MTAILSPSKLILVANLTLFFPYGLILTALWLTQSKDAAASALAFAAALVFAHRAWPGLSPARPARPQLGFTVFALGTLLYAASVTLDVRVGVGISATMLIAAQVYMGFGPKGLRSLRLPLLLLLLATPVPGFVLGEFSRFLLDALVAMVPAMLGLLVEGPVSTEGYHVFFGEESGKVFSIVEDCSGLGGVLLFIPLAFILLEAFRPIPLGRGLTVVAVAVPLAFAASLPRILSTALMIDMDSELVNSVGLHEAIGILSLGAAMVLLALLCRAMRVKS